MNELWPAEMSVDSALDMSSQAVLVTSLLWERARPQLIQIHQELIWLLIIGAAAV